MGDVEISLTFNLRFGGKMNCKKVRPTEATLAAADKHFAWCAGLIDELWLLVNQLAEKQSHSGVE